MKGGATVRRALAGALLAAAPAVALSPVQIRASRQGFTPSVVTLHKAETVRIVLSSVDGEHCFAVDELRVEKRIRPGQETSFDLTPDRAGTFRFYCCLETGRQAEVEQGRLEVAE